LREESHSREELKIFATDHEEIFEFFSMRVAELINNTKKQHRYLPQPHMQALFETLNRCHGLQERIDI